MLLGYEQGIRFSKLFCGLLDYTNKKYNIVPGLVFSKGMPKDMEPVADVKAYLWENDRIIDDYVKENPYGLNIAECDAVLKWKYHDTARFFYIEEDDGYSVFMDNYYFYYVTGHTKEIKEMLADSGECAPVETTLLPFEDAIVYDLTMAGYAISSGPNMTDSMKRTYEREKENDNIIKDGNTFIRKMKVPEGERTECEPEPLPGSDDLPEMTEAEMMEEAQQRKELELMILKETEQKISDLMIGRISKKRPVSDSLHDVLTGRTKKQLMIIIKSLRISHVSTCNKAQLVKILEQELLEQELITKALFICKDEEMDFINKVVAQGDGEFEAENTWGVFVAYSSIDIAFYAYEKNGKVYFMTTNEFRAAYKKICTKEFLEHRDFSNLILHHADALVGIYGVAKVDDLIDDLKKHYDIVAEKDRVLAALEEQMDLDRGIYEIIDDYIVNFEIADDPDWFEYVKSRNETVLRKEYPLSTLKKYYNEDYYEETEELKLLKEFFYENCEEIHFNEFMIDSLVAEIYDSLVSGERIDGTISILEDNYVIFEFDKMDALLQLIMAAKNAAITWGNNGWTPKDLHAHFNKEKSGQKKAKKKVGRNDPCPCGSGKKYKYCCMLKNN
ncbi:MAG: SEC-C domain-containing protein [Eubacteriaceae bacterium]|nr:SEC-C domain-containing protein [Eubacteriaceae bacterium]